MRVYQHSRFVIDNYGAQQSHGMTFQNRFHTSRTNKHMTSVHMFVVEETKSIALFLVELSDIIDLQGSIIKGPHVEDRIEGSIIKGPQVEDRIEGSNRKEPQVEDRIEGSLG